MAHPSPARRRPRAGAAAGLSLASALLAACAGPLDGPPSHSLHRSIVDSVRAEMEEAQRRERPQTHRTPADLGIPPERVAELAAIAGPDAYAGDALPIGPDLLGGETQGHAVSLFEAVDAAARHNLDALAARVTPAVRAEQLLIAEAVFDWTLFASASVARNETPSAVPVINGVPIGVAVSKNDTQAFGVGVTKLTRSGGVLTLSTDAGVFNNRSAGISRDPDPARTADLDLALSQPLLRGFGEQVNLAQVRLAASARRASVEDLRAELIRVVTQTEQTYWDLVRAQRELLIRERLLQRGVETRDALRGRIGFDVTSAQLSDAVATVESRRAQVIRAQNRARAISDQLKALMNDPRFPLEGEALLVPEDDPMHSRPRFSLVDALAGALEQRPEIRAAALRIDDADIRVQVARNARRPLLDLDARVNLIGLDDNFGDAYEEAFSADHPSTSLGLLFEQAIGNRAAEAELRRARLERVQSVVGYQRAVQQAVLDVKSALRDVQTNGELIEQTRIGRIAAAENLRALIAEEETVRSLTPEFLNLKLTRQQALANAEIEELQAVVDYSRSVAELYAAMGVTLDRLGLQVVEPEPGFGPDRFDAALER